MAGRSRPPAPSTTATGDYYVALSGFLVLPEDPFDSGSGTGAASEGGYGVEIGLNASDVDVYAVTLRAGDVLSGSVAGAATELSVSDPTGKLVFGSNRGASYISPMDSPLVGGGKAVGDHVAQRNGGHYVAVIGGGGNYDVTLESTTPARSPSASPRRTSSTSTGPGSTPVSSAGPESGSSRRSRRSWAAGGSRARRRTRSSTGSSSRSPRTSGPTSPVRGITVRILNSRDHADPWGKPNVSRVIIGSTIAESGVATIGVAQSIDPGNYETEETALMLLDVVSGSAADEGEASFNYYLTPASNRVRFVGTALGNLASHEAGHYAARAACPPGSVGSVPPDPAGAPTPRPSSRTLGRLHRVERMLKVNGQAEATWPPRQVRLARKAPMSTPSKRRSSTGTRASQATREALVAAAIDTLAGSGYAGATARAIGARANCNQALIFYHFGSLDGLLLAALEAVSQRRMATLGKLVDQATTPGDLVTVLGRMVTDDVSSGDLAVLVALIDASRGSPPFAHAVRDALDPWQDLTERVIHRLVATHPLGALVPVAAIARLTMAAVLGLELLSIPDGPDSPDLNDLLAHLRALTRGADGDTTPAGGQP